MSVQVCISFTGGGKIYLYIKSFDTEKLLSSPSQNLLVCRVVLLKKLHKASGTRKAKTEITMTLKQQQEINVQIKTK